jgi:hypothetical protein
MYWGRKGDIRYGKCGCKEDETAFRIFISLPEYGYREIRSESFKYTECSKKTALQWYTKWYCVASVQDVEPWIVCTHSNANVFVTLATQ